MDVGVMYLASRPATLAIPLRLYQGWLQVYHNSCWLAKLSRSEKSSKHTLSEHPAPEKFLRTPTVTVTRHHSHAIPFIVGPVEFNA